MRRNRLPKLARHALSWGVTGGIGLIMGCKSEQACGGLSVGTRLAVTFLGSAPPQSGNPVCDFGIANGLVVDATVVAGVDKFGGCMEAIPEYDPIGSWTWTLQEAATIQSGANGRSQMQGLYTASNGTCQGELGAALVPTGPDLFAPAEAGAAPPDTLEVFFRSSRGADAGAADPSCPSLCEAVFPVSVGRLP
jgi:hypothetical protein